jgi:limonene-1,2-epoxide hydrolase
MPNPAEVIAQFYGALHREDYAAARQCLGEPFSFIGWFDRFDRADDYIDALKKLRGFIVKIDVHRMFVDGGEVCFLYDAHTARGAVTIVAGWFRLRDEKIVAVRIICDPRPFAEFWGQA